MSKLQHLRPPRRLLATLAALAAACGGLPPAGLPSPPGMLPPAALGAHAPLGAPGGLQPLAAGGGAERLALMDPETCGSCHAEHFAQWRVSTHAHASSDPVFVAMNRRGQRETHGQMGSFCVSCHAPAAVSEGATVDGLNLAELPSALRGVTCYACHTTRAVVGAHNNGLVAARDDVMRGGLVDPAPNGAHASLYAPLFDRNQPASARLCGSCHDVTNGHGVDLERTFAEYQASAFAASGAGTTCGQCHMHQAAQAAPVATGEGLPARRAHDHTFPAVDLVERPEAGGPLARATQNFLDHTLQAALCVMPLGEDAFALRVVLDNAASGHSFPSGAASDRRLWVEVVAEGGGRELFASGVGDDVAHLMRAPDPDLWMMRECLFDAKGAPVSMFWEAFGAESNALGALATRDAQDPSFFATHRVGAYPRDVAGRIVGRPERVRMRVRLQAIGADVVDDLVASGDLALADARPAPILTLANTRLTWTPAALAAGAPSFVERGVPAFCVSTPGFNPTAPRRPAQTHSRCRP